MELTKKSAFFYRLICPKQTFLTFEFYLDLYFIHFCYLRLKSSKTFSVSISQTGVTNLEEKYKKNTNAIQEKYFIGNAQLVQKVTFEPLMDLKKTIMEVANITKAAPSKSFLHLIY